MAQVVGQGGQVATVLQVLPGKGVAPGMEANRTAPYRPSLPVISGTGFRNWVHRELNTKELSNEGNIYPLCS